jgi:hypothetical protein
MKQEVINKLLKVTEEEIIKAQIMADFYENVTADESDKPQYILKANQVKSTLAFNQKFYDYLKSL